MQGLSGNIMTNDYLEYGNLVYDFNNGYKLSFWSKQLDYQGVMPPAQPDNEYIYNLIYPRFA